MGDYIYIVDPDYYHGAKKVL